MNNCKIEIDECRQYLPDKREYFVAMALNQPRYLIWKFQKLTRQIEKHPQKDLYYLYLNWRRNRLAHKLGIELGIGVFDEGLQIFHSHGIVVNSSAHVGKNCHLHGNNCIGNNGVSEGAPVIGDNCTLGVGSKVLGEITLGNNVTIAAGAVVVRSFPEDNIVLAGIPAKIVKRI